MQMIDHEVVPVNYQGKPVDLEFSVTLASEAAAHELFSQAMERLLQPNSWHDLAGWASAEFTLIGADGTNVIRNPEEGDYCPTTWPKYRSAAANFPLATSNC